MITCKLCSKDYHINSSEYLPYNKKTCRTCYNTAQRAKLKQRITKSPEAYFKYAFGEIKRRCKRLNREIGKDIDHTYLLELFNQNNGCCPIIKVPLKMDNEGRDFDSISIDRIDNSKGYIRGNIQVVSFGYNALKHTWSTETALMIAKRTVEHFEGRLE